METVQEKGPTRATIDEVVMKKAELLQALEINKAKHDIVLQTAISGYWSVAQQKLEHKERELLTAVKDWKDSVKTELEKFSKKVESKELLPPSLSFTLYPSVNNRLDLVYPEDHSRDYERVYRMMKASVFDEVYLTAEEFDCYVLNNWEWKKNFISCATQYMTGAVFCSGFALRPFRDYGANDQINLINVSGNPSGYVPNYSYETACNSLGSGGLNAF